MGSNLQALLAFPSTFRAVLTPTSDSHPTVPRRPSSPRSCVPRKSHSHDRARQALVTQIVLRFYKNVPNTHHMPSAVRGLGVHFVLRAAACDLQDGSVHPTGCPSVRPASSPFPWAPGSHVRRRDAGKGGARPPSPCPGLPPPRTPGMRCGAAPGGFPVFAPRPLGFSRDPLWLSEAESGPARIPVLTAFACFKPFKLQAKCGR